MHVFEETLPPSAFHRLLNLTLNIGHFFNTFSTKMFTYLLPIVTSATFNIQHAIWLLQQIACKYLYWNLKQCVRRYSFVAHHSKTIKYPCHLCMQPLQASRLFVCLTDVWFGLPPTLTNSQVSYEHWTTKNAQPNRMCVYDKIFHEKNEKRL